MQTRDIGRFFFHSARLIPGTPLIHTGWAQEIEEPFRYSKVIVARLPFTRWGVAIGWWRDSGLEEHEALMISVDGTAYGDLFGDLDSGDRETRAQVRHTVAKNTETVEEEWEVLNALGLMEE